MCRSGADGFHALRTADPLSMRFAACLTSLSLKLDHKKKIKSYTLTKATHKDKLEIS